MNLCIPNQNYNIHLPIHIIRLLKKTDRLQNSTDVLKKNKVQDNNEKKEERYLTCTICDYPITSGNNRTKINDKFEHVFANPHGYVYHIGCYTNAPGCILYGEESSYFSWFSGFTWRIALCAQCGAMLGWFFHSKEFQFYGIILKNIH